MNKNLIRFLCVLGCCVFNLAAVAEAQLDSRPPGKSRLNILLCISDDQSYAHTGANGDPIVKTPAFDRVAREGVRFTHAFCDAPTCGPSRSAILTGQPIWRLEEAGNIHSTLPAKFETYTELLEKAGYTIGFAGKGWSPGKLEPGGRTRNPAGSEFSRRFLANTQRGISNKDYAKNFEDFLEQRPEDKPFCFWLGTHEPHRGYKKGAGISSGKDPKQVNVPAYLPDHSVTRNDILDYYVEIEHFDKMVGRALEMLEKAGQLNNTLVVITSDHGMPFPRAKASLYDAGSHVPLAIRWPNGIKSPGRVFDGFVSLSDLAPTFLEAAGLQPPAMMTAHSLMNAFTVSKSVPQPQARDRAFIAMERHDGCRKGGKGYPTRAIRKSNFLYILNHEPDRWPAGDPDASVCARAIPYGEVDSSPTKQLLMDNADTEGFRHFHELAFAKRPGVELYDLRKDPGQVNNVAGQSEYEKVQKRLSGELQRYLVETKDPRALGQPAPWDFYPYYGMRKNKNWKVDEP